MLMYFMIAIYFLSVVGFIYNRKHLLLMLLSLEFIVIFLFLSLFIYLSMMNYEVFFSLIFLTMSVCEGVLGLSILIHMVRIHGNDFILTLNFLW